MVYQVLHKPEFSGNQAWGLVGTSSTEEGAMDEFKSPGDLVGRSILMITKDDTCVAFGIFLHGQTKIVEKPGFYLAKRYSTDFSFHWDFVWNYALSAEDMLYLASRSKTNRKILCGACVALIEALLPDVKNKKVKVKMNTAIQTARNWMAGKIHLPVFEQVCREMATIDGRISQYDNEVSLTCFMLSHTAYEDTSKTDAVSLFISQFPFHLNAAMASIGRSGGYDESAREILRSHITVANLIENISVDIL